MSLFQSLSQVKGSPRFGWSQSGGVPSSQGGPGSQGLPGGEYQGHLHSSRGLADQAGLFPERGGSLLVSHFFVLFPSNDLLHFLSLFGVVYLFSDIWLVLVVLAKSVLPS